MADPKKKTFTDFVQQGPDPVDDAKVTEFAQRSQDPRAAPWEALRRGGARLDSALGTGPGSTRSGLSRLVENAGRYLQPPNQGSFGPEVGSTRDVGHFESLAQKLPEALTSPALQAMAFPTGDESLEGMRSEAVTRDALGDNGAAPVPLDRFGKAGLVPLGGNARAHSGPQFLLENTKALDQQSDAIVRNAKQGGYDPYFDWHETEPDFAPVERASRSMDEATVGEPSPHPERPSLERFLSKLYGPK